MSNTNDNKLSFEEFTEKLKMNLRKIYQGCKITTVTVTKNNGHRLTGITIKSDESNISPNIYLNGFYEEYREGVPLEDILNGIQALYEEYRITGYVDISSIRNFESAKSKICCRLINADRNRELLQTLPYRLYQDLAIIYYIPMSTRQENDAIITIRNDLMNYWQTDEATLYARAKENTPQLFEACIQPINDLIHGLSYDEPLADISMYVVRNNSSSGGAAVILYEDVLREFADTYDDFYILPSSIYEVIFVPVYAVDPEKEDLGGMVREVNSTAVSPEDQLSDHVYYYHADTGTVEICR